MIDTIISEKLPIKMWLPNTSIEESALTQAKNLANLPFAFHHIVILPDVHTGYGMPIGSVVATKNVIIPHAVGSDIGCGMKAAQTDIKRSPLNTSILEDIKSEILKRVPVGFHKHLKVTNKLEDWIPHPAAKKFAQYGMPPVMITAEYDNAVTSMGTLGSGNHFIELQVDEEDMIWVMIHTGSRHLGYAVDKHFNEVAITLNKRYFSKVETEKELAFLHIDTSHCVEYLKAMTYCIEYAKANRRKILSEVYIALDKVLNTSVVARKVIDVAHNYAVKEMHFGEEVWVHRKGAILAELGKWGIIPGCQGTNSYIVEGLGESKSFRSCSHGAGRKMSRKKAKAILDLEQERMMLDMKGVVHSMDKKEKLDEAMGAYKDIGTVLKNQEDLVKVLIELKSLLVIKG